MGYSGRAWSCALALGIFVALSDGQSTVFDVLFTPVDGEPAPQEYFAEMQTYIQDTENSPLYQEGSGFNMLSKVDPDQEIKISRTLIVCDLDPFWEKGAVRYDVKDCPLSVIKVVVYALIPTTAMFFALIGLWSKQANVGGRGKDTQVGSLSALGISLLSIAYDWFFCATIFTEPKGEVQKTFSELGLGHLVASCLVNFICVHCWFRRKYLVGMPWYEFHKHGVGLHLIFSIMYFQPQTATIFTSRLFNIDLFNIHFGTPSKMNEVLSKLGCLSLFNDIPQFLLQLYVWMEAGMNEAPAVSRVSMGLSVISVAMVLKRQYIAVVERQWYKEIVRMAGVRRLTTYGGASRWLKLKKRGSAAAQARQASTSQQQLFLAWMQSMGRRQESVFAGDTSGGAIQDYDSEDSEDLLDELSSSSEERDASGAGSKKPSGGGEDEGSGSGSEAESASFGEGSEEERDEEDGSEASSASGSVVQQRFRRGRRDDTGEEEGMGRRRPGGRSDLLGYARDVADGTSAVTSALRSDASSGDLLGFARGVVDDLSGTGITSESDVFAFARNVAGAVASESGFVTESSAPSRVRSRRRRATAADRRAAFDDVDDLSIGDESSGFRSGTDVLSYARRAADDTSGFTSALGDSESGTGDILGFAKRIARDASQSGVGGSRVSESDILAFAQQVAGAASEVSGTGTRSDILAFAREVAGQAPSQIESGVGLSGIFGVAQRAAEDASESGAGSESDIMGFALRVANGDPSSAGVSQATSGSDIFAAARRAAGDVSRSGVGASRSGVGSVGGRLPSIPSAPPSEGGSESDIMAGARRAAGGVSASGVGTEGDDSDIFGFALKAAENISRSGVGASQSGVGSQADGRASSDDIFAAAQNAAENASRSGVGSGVPGSTGGMSDIFGTAVREAADMQSGVGSDGSSDIFAAARAAAGDASQSGVGTARDTSRSTGFGGMSDLFAPVSRSRAGEGFQGGQLPGATPDRLPAPPEPGSKRAAPAPPMSSRSAISEDDDDDIFAAARRAADDASQSGVQSMAHSTGMSAGMQDIFGGRRPKAEVKPKVAPPKYQFQPPGRGGAPPNDMQSDAGSDFDIIGAARAVADDASQSGVGSGFLGAALGAAAEASRSGVGSDESDIFAAARNAAGDASRSGVSSGSDIFAAARRAAQGAGSVVSGASGLGGGGSDFEFMQQVPQRQRVGRHASAPPLEELDDGDQPPWAQRATPRPSPSQDQPSRVKRSSGLESSLFAAPTQSRSIPQPLSPPPLPPSFPKTLPSPTASEKNPPQSPPPPLPQLPKAQTAVATNGSFFRPLVSKSAISAGSKPQPPPPSSPPRDLQAVLQQQRQAERSQLEPSRELPFDSVRHVEEGEALDDPHAQVKASPNSANLTSRHLFDFARDVAAGVHEPITEDSAEPVVTDADDIFLRRSPCQTLRTPKGSYRPPEAPETVPMRSQAILGNTSSQAQDPAFARAGIMAFARSIAAQATTETAEGEITSQAALEQPTSFLGEAPPSPRTLRRLAEQQRNVDAQQRSPTAKPPSLPGHALRIRSGPAASTAQPGRVVPPLALGGRLAAHRSAAAASAGARPVAVPQSVPTETMKGVQEFMLTDDLASYGADVAGESQNQRIDTMQGVQEFLLTSSSAVERSKAGKYDSEEFPITPRNTSGHGDADDVKWSPQASLTLPASSTTKSPIGSPQQPELSPKEKQERQRLRREMLLQEGEHRDYKRKHKRSFNMDTEDPK